MFALRPLTVYVRVRRDWLSVRIVETGGSYENAAMLVFHRDARRIMAIGTEAQEYEGRRDFEVVRPFDHPRVAIDNPEVASKLLANFVQRALGRKLMLLKPRYVLHLPGDLEGGLTALEKRGFLDMARYAGAGWAVLWDSAEELDDRRIVELSRVTEWRILPAALAANGSEREELEEDCSGLFRCRDG